MNSNIIFKAVSSLEKVLPDKEPIASQFLGAESIFRGETYSFQIAYKGEESKEHCRKNLNYKIVSDVSANVTVRRVANVACEMIGFADSDDDFINDKKPGLYPDILCEIDDKSPLIVLNVLWKSVWVEFQPNKDTKAGIHDITIEFYDDEGTLMGSAGTKVELIDVPLKKQELMFTQWLHGDCISTYYKLDSLSDRHFDLLQKYIKTAVDNGINMILTPLFTPPLDTKVGGERPTIQLVDVKKSGDSYEFGFDKLKRFIDICNGVGVEYFEMSHLFTQWGAKCAPKIMATVDGEYKKIFGWETSATSDEYKAFLDAFLPQLTQYLKDIGVAKRTIFHISDEPSMAVIEEYKAAFEIVKEHLKDFTIVDALSNIEFWKLGIIKNPIPSTRDIKDFLDNKIENLWTYYCCGQANGTSNRFIGMSSARNRIIAAQLFKYDIVGFLQWGYNFWYSQYSIKPIDPFSVTDAYSGFPAGDSFSVYPGENGPLESIRLKVFTSALYDLRAMQMLAQYIGKEAVLNIIEENIEPIEFDKAPHNEDYILSMRIKINNAIKIEIAKKV